MRKYLVVIEKAKGNYSAYTPDIPGCVATGRTRAQTHARMRTAIRMHLDALREEGRAVPSARASAEYVAVD